MHQETPLDFFFGGGRGLNASNDIVSCTDVPFGRPENKISHFNSISTENGNYGRIFDKTKNIPAHKGLSSGDAHP